MWFCPVAMAHMKKALETIKSWIPARDGGLTGPRLAEAMEEMSAHEAEWGSLCRLPHIDRGGVQVVIISLLCSADGSRRILATSFDRKTGMWELSQPHGDFGSKLAAYQPTRF